MQPSQKSVRKRFYKRAAVADRNGTFWVELDERPIRTPAGAALTLKTRPLATAIAAEWEAQGDMIAITSLSLTRIANSAIDGVSSRQEEVMADLLRYASSDLIFYRAPSPPELVAKQTALWDPVLKWARETIGVNFVLAEGVNWVEQPKASIEALHRIIRRYDPFQLAALHVMVGLTGSALLVLAHASGHLSLDEAWAAAHVDEDYHISQWGEDYEAKRRRQQRFEEMKAASCFFHLADISKAGPA